LYTLFLNDPTAFLLYFTGLNRSKHKKNTSKNTLKKIPVFYNDVLTKKPEKSLKMTPKIISNREFILGLAVLGRSWGTFGATASFEHQKM